MAIKIVLISVLPVVRGSRINRINKSAIKYNLDNYNTYLIIFSCLFRGGGG